jgi:uncharacterized membrane protein
MEAFWLALQESAFAGYIRNSVFIYPVANILHVVAVIAFFGLVATMDLRLMKVFGGVSAAGLVERLRPMAAGLLVVIILAGLVLFLAEASALAANPVFQIKMLAILLALANIGLNDRALRRHGEDAPVVRITAVVSLIAWLSVAALGRGIAYV